MQLAIVAALVVYLVGYAVTVCVLGWMTRRAGLVGVLTALRLALGWPALWLERWLNRTERNSS